MKRKKEVSKNEDKVLVNFEGEGEIWVSKSVLINAIKKGGVIVLKDKK